MERGDIIEREMKREFMVCTNREVIKFSKKVCFSVLININIWHFIMVTSISSKLFVILTWII